MQPTVQIRYRRPPDREDIYVQKLVLDAADVKVTLSENLAFTEPLRVGGRIVCETGADILWFTFPHAWYDVGRFHRADGTFTGYYTNIVTPPEFEAKGSWITTDLFLDVWQDVAGEIALLDQDQFDEAVARGWLETPTAERARAEAACVHGLAVRGLWPPPVASEWTLARAREQELARDDP